MSRQRIVIVGAGGVARELRWLIAEINAAAPTYEFLGCVVSDIDALGQTDSADLVLGDYRWLEEHGHQVDSLAIGIGSPKARRRVSQDLERLAPKLERPALVHPGVQLERASCRLGRGVVIAAGVVGTTDIEVQDFALVGAGCVLGHEAKIGRWSALNPNSTVSGGVRVGDEVLVGSGAVVLQYLRIGDGATVGAGAVVTKAVADGTTVVGVPARPLVEER